MENTMAPIARYVKDSAVEMTEYVFPNDTNQMGNLYGGRLMHWLDICAAISASRHSNKVCVTASVDEINFIHPVRAGEVVILRASVNRVFRTSMEVGVKVFSQNLYSGAMIHTNTAYFTFVAIDEAGRPSEVAQITPESEDEKRRYILALTRRETRLQHRKHR
jgi:acyl-CoA hydrolase